VLTLALVVAQVGAALVGPPRPGAVRSEVFRVVPGDSALTVGQRLAAHRLIRSPLAFRALSEWQGVASRLRPGEYRLSPGMSLFQVLAVLRAGHILEARVSIPEGFTVAQIIDRLVAAHVASRRALTAAFSRPLPGLGAPRGVRYPTEGFVFPDTYLIPLGTSARGVVLSMWDDFRQRTRSLRTALDAAHLTLWQWVTLASIVQAEDARPGEAPKVAAVFLNRLKRGMPLDSDATVRYALARPVARLLLSDLTVRSPYNTYRRRGLPPGPIDSPGLVALRAVLHPARVPYLYFVATPSGRDLFATTYAQHLANVARLNQSAPSVHPSGRGPEPRATGEALLTPR
jgi:UPF0755 protein